MRHLTIAVDFFEGGVWKQLYLRLFEFIEIWRDVKLDAIKGPGQSDATDEEDEEHEVRVCGREVHHLSKHNYLVNAQEHIH